MNNRQVIKKCADAVKRICEADTTGHDWWHIQRVVKNALYIGKREKADLFIVEMAALLHDIDDWKFNKNYLAQKNTNALLKSLGVDPKTSNKILDITRHISFKGGTNKVKMTSVEGKVVQDADRLDASGAIGVARVFAFGGYKNREIHNPNVKVVKYTPETLFKVKTTSINHFYEKLLLIKDLMNTKTGKRLAVERHNFMVKYLKQFYKEWEKVK